jgi:tetratricopeptide (TPR) repeat protein
MFNKIKIRNLWHTPKLGGNKEPLVDCDKKNLSVAIDTFGIQKRRGITDKFLRKTKKLNVVTTENAALALRNIAPHEVDFFKLQAVLKRQELGEEERLWFGISMRLRGEDAESILAPLLDRQGYDRIAMVNIIANYLNKIHPDRSQEPRYLAQLDEHINNNPHDVFARLLQSLMLFQSRDREKAFDLIEQLYLDSPSYSPSLSVMASYLYLKGIYEGAESFAKEALEKNPENAQAYAIVESRKELNNRGSISLRFRHVDRLIGEVLPQSILYCKYAMLDPLC